MSVIHQISLRNTKSIVSLDYEVPEDASVIYVMGENEAGKSTVLDSLTYVLAGKKAIPEGIIQNGQERARIEMTLDDGTHIVRRFTLKGSTLTATLPDGSAAPGGPQELVGSLIDPIALDPLKFSEMDAKGQRETLLRVAGKADALDEINKRRTSTAEERTIVGRELKRLEGAAQTAEPIPDDLPEEAPDVAEWRKSLESGIANNHARDNAELQLEADRALLAGRKQRVQEAKEELARMEATVTAQAEMVAQAEKDLQAFACADVGAMRESVDDAERIAEAVRNAETTRKILADLKAKRTEHGGLNDAVESIDSERVALLGNLDIGIKGAVIDGTDIKVDGVLFHNLSTSQRLKFGCALAMKNEPGLRMIRIRNGNTLDKNSREFLERLSKEQKFQLWIEYVQQGDKLGLMLTESVEDQA